jgi:wyosine [tRNA(Phe)-imidazoG37] synthetase (radical SAM superfamily)
MTYRHLFGPILSRRLGRSLGIDIVPLKTCSYNCVYCQLGPTATTTLERRRYVDPAAVLAEVEDFRSHGGDTDYATFSGSGEPTLSSDLGDLIVGIKERLHVPVAVLTNGSLLWDPVVRADLARADLVCPTLDAADAETFRRINRPHPSVDFDRMVQGLVDFTREFAGAVWLEVFLVEGVNTSAAQIGGIRRLVERIAPARVQLNTAVRPAAEADVHAIRLERLEEYRQAFGPTAELIPSPRLVQEAGKFQADQDRLLAAVARHPATAADLAAALDMNTDEVSKCLTALVSQRRLAAEERQGEIYYATRDEKKE